MHPNNTVYFLASDISAVEEPFIDVDITEVEDDMLTKAQLCTEITVSQDHLTLLTDACPTMSDKCRRMITSIRDSLTEISGIVSSKDDRWINDWNDELSRIYWSVRDVKSTVTSLLRNNFRDMEVQLMFSDSFLQLYKEKLNIYRNVVIDDDDY